MTERDDGFRRLDEPSPLEGHARARRTVEALDAREDELAPRNAGAILDAGIDALRARFGPCFAACVLIWVGPVWWMSFAPPEPAAFQPGDEPMAAMVAQIVAALLQSLLTSAAQIFSTILVSVFLQAQFSGDPMTIRDAAALVLRRFPAIVGCTILVALMSFAGIVACILPYFWVLWRVSLAPLMCALERRGPMASIQRSIDLTKGSFLRWCAITIVAFFLVLPLSGIAGGAAQGEVRDAALENLPVSTEVYATVLWIVATLFFALATAVTAAITTAYYFDCRVRREGLDLRARLDAIAGGRAAGVAA